jgi:hypothetical protein
MRWMARKLHQQPSPSPTANASWKPIHAPHHIGEHLLTGSSLIAAPNLSLLKGLLSNGRAVEKNIRPNSSGAQAAHYYEEG